MKDPVEETGIVDLWQANMAALRPILATSQPSKFRAVKIICPRDHELMDIIRTPVGLVALYQDDVYRYDADGRCVEVRARTSDSQVPLDPWPLETISSRCRCGRMHIPVSWIREQAKREERQMPSRRRAIWTGQHTSEGQRS